MKFLNNYVFFTIIVVSLALMDVFNFIMPRNTGFFSITDGYFDMWHLLKLEILALIAIKISWNVEDTNKLNVLRLVVFATIAIVGQLVTYNGLFKLL